LPEYGQLIIELPLGNDVIGYYAEPVAADAVANAWDQYAYWDEPVVSADYDDIRYYGEMSLGYAMLGDAVWDYDGVSKVLTVNGPYDFENANPDNDSLLYHGAPWIEFNVIPPLEADVGESVDASLASSPSTLDIMQADTTSEGDERISLSSASAMVIGAFLAVVFALSVNRKREWC